MKVSRNWIQEYLAFLLPDSSELVRRIGAQLGGVEETLDIGAQYNGVIVVKVVECARLENSDHLNLCFIDDGGVVPGVDRRDDGLVQVVCGAPNVRAGVTVAWLPPGSTVPSTYDGEPFVLEARALRGAVSNGMLASPKELAIGDSHEGLLLLEDDIVAGTDFAAAYKLDDLIIYIENKMFTHRPDCFGQLGIAREVAGILGQQFVSPEWYTAPRGITTGEGLLLTVQNQVPNMVPRFMAVSLQGITLAPSPVWLQTWLSRVGIRPINNVVDITNYMMVLTGQPLHAYDYDKVAALTQADGAVLTTRYPHDDEQLTLLSGKTVTPRREAIMIATDGPAIGLGGVMGGGNTEVDAQTTNIILECATFNMYSIRRTSMAHGLFTDAVTRYNKGQSPLQNPAVLGQAVTLMQELTGAQVASPVIDSVEPPAAAAAVTTTASFINSRLGLALTSNEIAALLENVECKTDITGSEDIVVEVPFWRTDIAIAEDIVEEVGRLYGFDRLPLGLPVHSIKPAQRSPLLVQKTAIRNSLSRSGANEVLSYSFVPERLLRNAGQNPVQAFQVANALSPDLQYYRVSGLPSLLEKVHPNIKAGYDSFALYELGKSHDLQHTTDDVDGLPSEFENIDFVFASKNNQVGAAYYNAQSYLRQLAQDLHVPPLQLRPIDEDRSDDPKFQPYDLTRSAMVYTDGDQLLGVVGEIKSAVRKQFKLPVYCAAFSLDQQAILRARQAGSTYRQLPRFPKVEQDICLRVTNDVTFASLQALLHSTLETAQPDQTLLQSHLLDIYQRPDDPQHKQITFRVSLANYGRTMTDQELSSLLVQVADANAQQFNAERI